MSRIVDKLRVLGSGLLFFHIAVFFLPMISIRQEYYPEQTYSQYSFCRSYLAAGTASAGLRIMTALFVILPLVTAVAGGVLGLIRKLPASYSIFCACASEILYLGQLTVGRGLWPERVNTAQRYVRCIGWWFLVILVCAVLLIQFLCGLVQRQSYAGQPTAQEDAEWMARQDEAEDKQEEPEKILAAREESKMLSRTQTELHLPFVQQDSGISHREEYTVSESAGMRRGENTALSLHPRGVLVGLAGIFAGQEIALRDGQTLRLGRDQVNDLVFTDAAHISRNHCQITWQAEQQSYLVEDRSRNGCYIDNAARIPTGVQVELKPGTVLMIGDRTNRFRLE